MTLARAFQEAVAALRFYQRRTVITIVSLAWGVACFVILMAYGNGFDSALRSAFWAIGQDLVLTMPGQTSSQAGGLRSGRAVRLELSDVNAIREASPSVGAISPEMMKRNSAVKYGTREKSYTLRGVRAEYQRIRNIHLASGRWLSSDDTERRNRVAVLGATVAKELFGEAPPEGEEITIEGIRFTVVGVMEAKGQLANYGRPDNFCLFLPYDVMSLFRDIRYPDLIVWTPVSGTVRDRAIQQVRETLAAIHKFSPFDDKAVEILAFNQFMHIINGMSLAVKGLLGFIGTLTLGIGGVGLANVMLASVIERTREIGVLKALGGARRWILTQFFLEAAMVVTAGGALGMAFGLTAASAVGTMPLFGALFREAAEKGNLEMRVSPGSLLAAMGVLVAVGLVASMIPAIKAARLDPIEALRYE